MEETLPPGYVDRIAKADVTQPLAQVARPLHACTLCRLGRGLLRRWEPCPPPACEGRIAKANVKRPSPKGGVGYKPSRLHALPIRGPGQWGESIQAEQKKRVVRNGEKVAGALCPLHTKAALPKPTSNSHARRGGLLYAP